VLVYVVYKSSSHSLSPSSSGTSSGSGDLRKSRRGNDGFGCRLFILAVFFSRRSFTDQVYESCMGKQTLCKAIDLHKTSLVVGTGRYTRDPSIPIQVKIMKREHEMGVMTLNFGLYW
jgi:hypothetical protein